MSGRPGTLLSSKEQRYLHLRRCGAWCKTVTPGNTGTPPTSPKWNNGRTFFAPMSDSFSSVTLPWYARMYRVNKHSFMSELRNVEYSILLVMSELSTVRCDRALGLWIAGTRASSVDGELPWRCCGRWTVRWTAVKGSRDRSSDRAAAVASTPGSRAQAATEGGFLGLRHKTKEADGG